MAKDKKIINKEIEERSSFLLGFFVNYFKPSAFSNSIEEIDLSALKEQGIKLIVCDLDNTLVPHFTKFPTKRVFDFVKKIKENNFEFMIVSNNSKKRVSFFSEKLGISNYVFNSKKPMPFKARKEINKFGFLPQEIVFIGDLIITDILVANFLNLQSILVQPLIDPEKINNKFLAFLEKTLFKKLSNDNLIVREISNQSFYNEDYEIL